MRRFDFRLEQLLRLKVQHERLADLGQARAQAVHDASLAELRVREDQVARLADRLAARDDPLSWLARQHQAVLAIRQLEQAQDRAAKTARALAEAAAARTKAATEVESLRHLRDQQWLAYRRQANKEHQEQLDDLGLRRWLRSQAEQGRDDDWRASP